MITKREMVVLRRRVRAIPNVIATILLVIIAIAMVLVFWFWSAGFMGAGGPAAEARAALTANTFIGVNQVVGVNLMIESKTDTPLYVRTVRMISDAGGSLRTHGLTVATAASPAWPSNFTGGVSPVTVISAGIAGEGIVRPRSTLTISMTLNFGTHYVSTLRFEIELVDPTGRAYWISTNEIKIR
ncbi:MAG: hypothetical protein QXQ91_02020 [Nanopusillaceae archaeon]